jgi:hypothetical protein
MNSKFVSMGFILKSLLFCFSLFVVVSCDDDSNELGSDIIGNDNFESGTPEFYNAEAINQSTGAVETLDLPVNALGIYKNPVFGTTKANLVIQLQLNTVNPSFNAALQPVVESVVLTVPYFSTRLSTNNLGESTYRLDSIYGPTNSKIKLKVFESKYYIRDIDPTSPTQDIQRYYSNQNSAFDLVKGLQLNDSNNLAQNEEFVFSAAEIVEPGIPTDEIPEPADVRIGPAIRLNLNVAFFQNKIINADPAKLLNNNVFKEYFRGLYFQVENSGADDGNLAMLNIKGGKITVKYNQLKSVPTAEVPQPEREVKTLDLNLNGKSVGFFENSGALNTDNDRIYLRGGEGSMAIIDLFGPFVDSNSNGVTDKLDELRANNWLVNDASLTFHIDNIAMGNSAYEPNRIYLYDLKNKRPLVDYYSDQNSPSSKPKYSKSVFGGIIKKTDSRGTSYKIRLTNHIRALISNADSTNVKLGLVVTENIVDISNKKLKTAIPIFNVSELPSSAITNPLGTILYGSGENVPLDKRIRLKIYFTKPKQN